MSHTHDLHSFITAAVRDLPIAFEPDTPNGGDLGLDAVVTTAARRTRLPPDATGGLAAAFREPKLHTPRAAELTAARIEALIAEGEDPYADTSEAAATCLVPDHTHRLALLARASACLLTPKASAALSATTGILLLETSGEWHRDRLVSLLKVHLLSRLREADPRLSGLDPDAVYQTEEPSLNERRRSLPGPAWRMLASGGACLFVGDPDHLRPYDRTLVRARMSLPPLDAEMVVAILRGSHSLTGRLAEDAIRSRLPSNADLVRLSDLVTAAAFAAGSTLRVADRLSEFAWLLDTGCGDAPRPTLADLPGLPPETLTPLRAVIADVDAWRAGHIDWSEVPASFLLHGPPGTGKTLLAHAIAGEIGVPLVATSYADWQAEDAGHLGTFLKAMRASFDAAGTQAPCVLFVDELDSFARRSEGNSHGDIYSAKAVNGILAQMNRLADMPGVVFIGASIFPDRINPAIRRAGRIDSQIPVPRPDRAGLAAILRHYTRGIPIPDSVINNLSARFLGKTGADIAATVRRARSVARMSREDLSGTHLLRAADRVLPSEDWALLERIALHEAGHAVVGRALGLPPRRVGISMSGGYALASEPNLVTPDAARRRLAVMLAGRAAETLIHGTPSNGAGGGDASDLACATKLAAKIHLHWGFGNTLARIPDSEIRHAHRMPPAIRRKIETELQEAERCAVATLQDRLEELGQLANSLFAEREIDLETCPETVAKTSDISDWATDTPIIEPASGTSTKPERGL